LTAKNAESKKGFVSVIKYEGDNNTFIWKHPIEDFNYASQLIVHESQEAIFFRDGQALDTFGAGRHTLETQNLPLLRGLYALPTNADSVFHSEVYFINKTVQMAVKWGTPDKVRFIDPLTGTPLAIGASGEMNLSVSDSRRLLLKLVGTTQGIAWDNDSAGIPSAYRKCGQD
jgi:membrane protease subunit (stomatin/prohibitin family)